MESAFRKNLRSELDYQLLTVKELSAKTGIPKPTLDCYLGTRASMPPVDIAVKLAKVLDVSVEYLVTGQESRQGQAFAPYRELIAELSKLSEESRLELQPLLLAQVREKQKQERKKNSEKIYAG